MINDLIKRETLNFWYENPTTGVRPDMLFAGLKNGDDLSSRKTYPLHVTASAIVLDTKRSSVLLVRHAFLRKWVFPGGHLDPDETLVDAAIRETLEETGLDISKHTHELFDIDTHSIPANSSKKEPSHNHCDFRYLFEGPVDRSTLRISDESTGYLWVEGYDDLDHWKGPTDTRNRLAVRMERNLKTTNPEKYRSQIGIIMNF